VGRQRDCRLSDSQLLERFAKQHDEGAFAVLVERHGPMVLRTCRRVLHDQHAAEDAFQATFLVLIRKAASIREGELLGNWLYGVAYRTAKRARAEAAQRFSRESRVSASPPVDSLAELSARELCAALDEELDRLPQQYRAPFFLCFIESRTRDQAARQLGWSLRTLHRRLERARKLLHVRLTRRGLTLSVALAALGLFQQGTKAAVPSLLVTTTIRTARPWMVGKSHTAAASTATAAALADRVLRSMAVIKLKAMATLVVTACLIASGAGFMLRREGESLRAPAAPVVAVAAAEEPKKPAQPSGTQEAHVDRYGDPLPDGALARLGTTRFRQGYMVYCAAFSPDGKSIVASSAGQGVHIWDAITGKDRLQLLPRGHVYAVAYTPDGNLIAGKGRGFGLFEVSAGAELRHFEGNEGGATMALAVSPDGKLIASGGHDSLIRLWETGTGMHIRQFEGHAATVRTVAFSPDGNVLASGSGDKTVRLWEVATGKEMGSLTGHQNGVASVAFAPHGKTLASASEDGTVRLWDRASKMQTHLLQAKAGNVASVAYSPDGKTLSSGHQDGTLHLWDVATGLERLQWQAHTYRVQTTAFSPNGKLLVSGAVQDCGPRVWEVATGKELHSFVQHRGAIDWLSYAADGKTLLSGSRDRLILQWNLADQLPSPWFSWPSSSVNSFAVSLSSHQLVTSGLVERMRIWDTTNKQPVRPLGPQGPRGPLGPQGPYLARESLAYSPDGRMIASGGKDGEVVLWDAVTGDKLRELSGLRDKVTSIAFSLDEKTLAAAAGAVRGRAGTICLWDVATAKLQRSMESPGFLEAALAFAPNGGILASAGGYEGEARLWDVASGKELRPLNGAQRGCYRIAFSPDGKWLAGGGGERDPAIFIWEVDSGQEALQFHGHLGAECSLAFSPDGRVLASGGAESMVLLWDMTGRLKNGQLQPLALTPQALETHWNNLAGDASQAHSAIWALVASPRAVPYFQGRLRPVAAVEAQRLSKLIQGLDDSKFDVRKQAMSELQEVGESSASALREELKRKPTLEVRQRIEQLLAQMEPAASPGRLQTLRAVQVLEYIGSPEAKRLLQSLASGIPEASLTQEAAASLRRLAMR